MFALIDKGGGVGGISIKFLRPCDKEERESAQRSGKGLEESATASECTREERNAHFLCPPTNPGVPN